MQAEPSSGADHPGPLVIGAGGDRATAVAMLHDRQLAGFTASEVALVASGVPLPAGAGRHFGAVHTLACRRLGPLALLGAAFPLRCACCGQPSACDLGRALVAVGLSDLDALIYELALIRGQALLIVAAPATRAQLAYRLLLRHAAAEVDLRRQPDDARAHRDEPPARTPAPPTAE